MAKIYTYKSLPHHFPFSMKFAEMDPYYCMDNTFHWHNYLEISYVKQGRGKYYIEDKTYEIQEGDIIVINNIEPHYMEVLPPVKMLQPVIMFDPQLVWSGENDFFDLQYLKPFFDRSSSFSNKIDSTSDVGREIFKLLTDIEAEYIRKPFGYELMIKAKMLHIISYLIRHYQDDAKQSEGVTRTRMKLKKLEPVFEYINSYYQNKILLEALAGLMFMSPNYFCSYFREATGLSPMEYVSKIRILKSVELLKTTEKSIFEIAMECGFTNLSNFNKLFRKHTGSTPREVRKM